MGGNQRGAIHMRRICTLFLAFCLPLAGQTPTGAIEGSILDPSGAGIPDATVSVTERATGRTIRVTTDSEGR